MSGADISTSMRLLQCMSPPYLQVNTTLNEAGGSSDRPTLMSNGQWRRQHASHRLGSLAKTLMRKQGYDESAHEKLAGHQAQVAKPGLQGRPSSWCPGS